jgi:hypothetical protein
VNAGAIRPTCLNRQWHVLLNFGFVGARLPQSLQAPDQVGGNLSGHICGLMSPKILIFEVKKKLEFVVAALENSVRLNNHQPYGSA